VGARVLIVGGGARGHALAERLLGSPDVERVAFAPGTSALERLGYTCHPVASQDFPGLVELAEMEEFDLTVVGPNTPLVDGIVDTFEAAGLPIFGPTRAAARLEGSKVYGRLLMRSLGVPTPRFGVADNPDRARLMARSHRWARVFKADGIAYDKGVRVTSSFAECDQAIDDVMVDNVYGLESERVVVEERIDGQEITLFSLTDGEDVVVMGDVLNYPRLGDGNTGPPTRGMGQVSPAPILGRGEVEELRRDILAPTVRELAERGAPLRGALFLDLMIGPGRRPYVIDYNVRFGDPATQTLLSAWSGDLYGALQACRAAPRDGGPGAESTLRRVVGGLHRDPRPRVSLVVVCEGYPGRFVRGAPISLDEERLRADRDVRVYFDGVRVLSDGALVTTGGRTLTLVAVGDTVAEARAKVYDAVGAVSFPGMHYRRDIGAGW